MIGGMSFHAIGMGIGLATVLGVSAADPFSEGVRPTDPLTPAEQQKTFQLPEGFKIELVAAEPDIQKPMNMAFDAKGRLWVSMSREYPFPAPLDKPARDSIRILEDFDQNGRARKITTFVDGLNIPIGMYPYKDGVIAWSIPNIWFFRDTDGDGKADKREVLYGPFGWERDTHGNQASFRRGFDGWLYATHGYNNVSNVKARDGSEVRMHSGNTYRMAMDGGHIEQHTYGQVNPFGMCFDPAGNMYTADCHSAPIYELLRGGYYPSFGKPHDGLGFAPTLMEHSHGSTAICGALFYADDQWPEEYQNNFFVGNVMTSRVNRDTLIEHGSSKTAREEKDLVSATDPWFRPVDLQLGPDGALYIADWYNPIIQHGEVDFRDPRRDKTHGRIWRITAKGRPLVPKPKLVDATVPELLEQLKSPEGWTRNAAKRVLKERGEDAVLPALDAWVKALPADAEHARLEAEWVRQSFGRSMMNALEPLLNAKEPHVRSAAVRIVSDPWMTLNKSGSWSEAALKDDHPQVRLEAVRAVAGWKVPTAVEHALAVLKLPMDPVLDYALWLTVRELEPYWLPAFKDGHVTLGGDARAIAFALNASGNPDAVKSIVRLADNADATKDQRLAMWRLLAQIGGPNEMTAVFHRGLTLATDEVREGLLGILEASIRTRKVAPAKLDGWEDLAKYIDDPRPGIRAAALRLMGLVKFELFRRDLQLRAADAKVDLAERAAAFDGLVSLGGPKLREFLDKSLAADQPLPTRRLAAQALANVDLDAAAKSATSILAAQIQGDPTELFNAFVSRKGGPAALAKALKDAKLPADVAKVGLRSIRSSSQNLPDLVAALTKAGDLGAAKKEPTADEVKQYVADVLKSGDAARGEAIYRRKELQCLNCHAIAGSGGQVGPDMTSIGASAQPDYLVESLLVPNKAVKEGYHAIEVNRLSGQIVSGIKLRESPKELVIRNAEDKEIAIPIDDIDTRKQTRSIMPDGLTDTLTRQEFVDLSRFLSELGKVGPYAPSTARLVRRWQYLDPTPAATNLFRRNRVTTAVEKPNDFPWVASYSKVSGDLPLAEIPRFVVWNGSEPLSVVRFHLTATVGGPTAIKLNGVEGLSIYVGEASVEAKAESAFEVKPGPTTVTVVVDRAKRKTDLKCELIDVANSPARVAIVGGK